MFITMKPTRILTTFLLAPLAALLCLTPCVSAEDRKPVLIESKRIRDKAQYNSFTDLTRFRDQWFCCFREGIALKLPSGGSDTGYAGMVWHNDELWVSYYSNHEDNDGNPPPKSHVELPTAIYLARIRFEK